MKKLIALFVVFGLLVGIAGVYTADAAVKKAPVKKKVVAKKKVAPKKVAPKKVAPAAPVAPAPPPPPPVAVRPAPAPAPMGGGLFGWGLKSMLSGSYLYNGKGQISGAIGGRFDLVLDDPLALGSMVGLSANAVKYRVGLGGVYGKDNANVKIQAFPVLADVVLMLPADMLGGIDSYVGGGLNYNLYGTGKTSGPYGIEAYVGIMGDVGLGMGKQALEVGYYILRAGGTGSSARSAKGITISVCQPLVL